MDKIYLLIEDEDNERTTILAFSQDKQEMEDVAARMCLDDYHRGVAAARPGSVRIPLEQTAYRKFHVESVDRFVK